MAAAEPGPIPTPTMAGTPAAAIGPDAPLAGATADPAAILFVTALATAVVGLIVAGYAYQGYRRNDSPSMRSLAVGIALVSAGPLVVSYGLAPALALSDATTLLVVLWVTIAGLLAILRSLGARRGT